MSRKRKRTATDTARPSPKRQKIDGTCDNRGTQSAVLNSCYAQVLSLREYFLARLPAASRVRRRRLEAWKDPDTAITLLDTCLVGVQSHPSPETQQERAREFVAFTQTQSSANACHTAQGASCSIQDIIDFAIWLLFRNCPLTSNRPRHLLCNGLQKGSPLPGPADIPDGALAISGIFQQHPNEGHNVLRKSPWDQYLSLLGADGESIVSSLLLDCGLFINIKQGSNNYLQISGTPISNLNSCLPMSTRVSTTPPTTLRKPSEIPLARHRILYAKASLNKRGLVHFGLRHVHVLQRYSRLEERQETVHIMKHIFPRLFGFANVFAVPKDLGKPMDKSPDFTYREEEFTAKSKRAKTWLPRRLRGEASILVARLRSRHARCSYTQLLRYHCPVIVRQLTESRDARVHGVFPSSVSTTYITQLPLSSKSQSQATDVDPSTDSGKSFLPYSTPADNVSAFCKAALKRLLPQDSLGTGGDGIHNWEVMLRGIDRFVFLRRFETITLEQVSKDLRISCIKWLRPPKFEASAKMSRSDYKKRLEVLQEFVYYVFDSLMIPLLRSNFYITESGVHRNKLCFFRHDVWRRLSEPSLAVLRVNLYKPLKSREVRKVFEARSLGYSNVRLLPKAEGARPITNLKRRMLKCVGGKRVLGPSINTQLGPVSSALGHERSLSPDRLGGAIFSTAGLQAKLKQFQRCCSPNQELYFVKLDIQSCFDTIPQTQLMRVINEIMSQSQYRTTRYTELKCSEVVPERNGRHCKQKFAGLAQGADSGAVLSLATAAKIVQDKDGLVLTDGGTQRVWQHRELMGLLGEHVQRNVVKIGKKHFQQTTGIPQGSVLSSALCSFFYSKFEKDNLTFLTPTSSLLVRLIDDFLLVTTDKAQAVNFLQVMIDGSQEYGISVNPDKTLTNFEVQIGTQKIPRCEYRRGFPYCGLVLDTKTLEVGRDWLRKDQVVGNGLTVDVKHRAARAFRRKTLLSLKMQMQAMLLDATLNNLDRIKATYFEAFEETAMKMHAYKRNMPARLRPSGITVQNLLKELIKVASRLGQRKQPTSCEGQVRFPVSRAQITWIATMAFERVLLPKQTDYQHVLPWLRSLRASETSTRRNHQALKRLVQSRDRVLERSVY